jgi:hypothetical protein
MKFILIKKMYLKNNKNKKGGNVPIINDINNLNKNFNDLNINGGSIIFRNKYKKNKIKLNI